MILIIIYNNGSTAPAMPARPPPLPPPPPPHIKELVPFSFLKTKKERGTRSFPLIACFQIQGPRQEMPIHGVRRRAI